MKKIFILLLLGWAIKGYSQVNLQTGSANYSLPMFNWQDDKSRLSSVVALSYNSGNGLKVSDVASNVGQGWSLIAGGVISRMQVGEPDDQPKFNGSGDTSDRDITKYPAGLLYASVPAYNGCSKALTQYPIYGGMNQLYAQHNITAEDKQADYFTFQFNGKSGMFVLDASNGDIGVPLGNTKMKITFQRDPTMITNTIQGIRTTITSFSIQDVDGMIYKFRQHGLTKILHTGYCDANLTQELTQPKFKQGGVHHQTGFDNGKIINPYVISNWYLSEIDDPLTHRSIVYQYTNHSVNSIAGIDLSDNRSTQKSYCIISHKRSITTTPNLSAVEYPDGHEVLIHYGNARVDLTGEYAIASIDMLYKGRYLSEYRLNTTYFILNRYGTPVTPYQKSVARLCLKSVQKLGVDLKEDTPPYVFDYYLGSDNPDDFVPPPFFYAKDVFGFYNGDKSIDYNGKPIPLQNKTVSDLNFDQLVGLCFLNKYNDIDYPNTPTRVYCNPKAQYAQNGLLKQIIYPTGGTLTYQYSQNVGTFPDANNASGSFIGGVSVSKTSSTDGGYSNGCDNPIVTNYKYVLSDESSTSVWGTETPVNTLVFNSHYVSEDKGYRWPPIPFGKCYWHYQYPGIMSQQEAISLSTFENVMNSLGPVLGIISTLSSIQDVSSIVTAVSGGTAVPVTVIIDVIVNVVSVALSCFGGDNDHNYSTTIYYNTDLNAASPLPAQFKRVEVVENTGSAGKTVQEFTSSDDYPVWEPTNKDFSSKQRFAPWAYGLPKLTSVYDVSGNLIKQTKNVYDTTKSRVLINQVYGHGIGLATSITGFPSYFVFCKCSVNKSYSQRSDHWSDASTYNTDYLKTTNADMSVDRYGMYSGRVELDTTYERVFKTTDATKFTETVTAYNYNAENTSNNYDVKKVTTIQSNGDINYKDIKYSSDYNTGVLSTLNQNNIFSLQVATATSVQKSGGAVQYLGEHVTEFTTTANGDIKPYRTLEQRFSQPTSSMTYYQGPGSSGNPTYKQTQLLTYDAASNLTGMQDEGGHIVSNIYDYNDKYVVASVINADPTADHSAYSSFETTGLGGWTLNGTASVLSASSVTGASCFVLSAANSLSATLNTSKAYTVSFWATNNSVSVSGGVLTKSAPTINGYTYYEYSITQGTSAVTVSGSANIDELRLYPQNARMRTVTYDPLIGKTSECDENNRITYYQYDNLGRLRFVQDEHKNTLKMYEYNNVSAAKQNGCPATYYNHLITEYFTKSNCSGGYFGSSVAYTVPAARYSSAISQADADAKAELDLNTNGPVAANSGGTCSQIFYNTVQTRTDTTQTCGDGYLGGGVTYTVPANRYASLISVDSANQMAIDELDANAQAYANDPAHAVCTINTQPVWVADSTAQTKCGTGNQAGHLLLWAHDINPNSATYNTSSWQDQGANSGCPISNGVNVLSENFIAGGYTMEIVLVNHFNSKEKYAFEATRNTNVGIVPQGVYDITVAIPGYHSNWRLSILSGSQDYSVFGLGDQTIYDISVGATSTGIIITAAN